MRRLLALLGAVNVLSIAFTWPASSNSTRWGKDYLPNVQVIDQEGRRLKFYDDVLKDKIVVISFVYTSCKNICPLVIARLAEVQAMLGDAAGRDVHFVSLSIDPIPDTPERLKKYAQAFGINSGWKFLTGKPDDIDLIRYKLGERSGSAIVQHKNEVLLYNDKTSEWARDSGFSDHTTLVAEIRAMDPAWRRQARETTSLVAHSIASGSVNVPGQALFIKGCSGCHSIGQGDKVGPDLKGVTARRQREWITRYIIDPEGMRAAKDTIALELGQKFSTVSMPNLGLAESDAADILNYLDARTRANHTMQTGASADHTVGTALPP